MYKPDTEEKTNVKTESLRISNLENVKVFGEHSIMGIVIQQRGYLRYFNKTFADIFGYTNEEIQTWKKREFYKIIHLDDLKNLLQKLTILDKDLVTVEFRGIKKDKTIIAIRSNTCLVRYNGHNAVLSSYLRLDNLITEKNNDKELLLIEANKNKGVKVNISEELFDLINLISKIRGIKPEELIRKELTLVFHAYLEECKRLLG